MMLTRPHLIARIGTSLEEMSALTLLHAPRGYGKSTLVAGWLQECGEWVRLSRRLYCQASTSFIDELNEIMFDPPPLIIIENYEVVSDLANDEALLRLLARGESRFLISTRYTELLAGWLSRAWVDTTVLDYQALSFTEDEARELLPESATEVDREKMWQIISPVAAWPLALGQCLSRVQQEDNSVVALRGVVRAASRQIVQSWFSELESPLAETVLLAVSRTGGTTETLLESRLGVPITQVQESVQLLLREGVIRREVKSRETHIVMPPAIAAVIEIGTATRELSPELYGFLGKHADYLAQTQPKEALRLYLKLGDLGRLQDSVVQQFSGYLQLEELAEAVQRFSFAELEPYPLLLTIRLMCDRDNEGTSPLTLRQGASALLRSVLAERQPVSREWSLITKTLHAAAERMLGDFPPALKKARELEVELGEYVDQEFWSPGSGLPMVYSSVAATAAYGGDMELATRCATRAFELATNDRNVHEIIRAHDLLAFIKAIEPDSETAEEHLRRSTLLRRGEEGLVPVGSWVNRQLAQLMLATQTGDSSRGVAAEKKLLPWIHQIEQWPVFLLAQSHLVQLKYGPEKALTLLGRSVQETHSPATTSAYLEGAMRYRGAVLALLSGKAALAQQILVAGDITHPQVASGMLRLQLFRGDYSSALRTSRQGRGIHVAGPVEVSMVLGEALALFGSGDLEGSAAVLTLVTSYVRGPSGPMYLYAFPFDLMQAAFAASAEQGGVDLTGDLERVIKADRVYSYPPLSEAEMEVLARLNSGGTLGDIAEELKVSANTVKFHRANIYRKLRVSDREHAIARAVDLGLLREWS